MNAKQWILGALIGASAVANANPVQWDVMSSLSTLGDSVPTGVPVSGSFVVNGDLVAGEPVTELLAFDFLMNGVAYGLADVTAQFEPNSFTISLGDRNLTPGADDFSFTISRLKRISDGVLMGHAFSALYTIEGRSGFYGGLDTQVSTTVLPEPGTYTLFGLGLAAVGFLARRKKATV